MERTWRRTTSHSVVAESQFSASAEVAAPVFFGELRGRGASRFSTALLNEMNSQQLANPLPPRGQPAAVSPPNTGSAAAIGAPASEPALAAPLNSQHKPLSTQPPSVPSVASCSKQSAPSPDRLASPAPLTPRQKRVWAIHLRQVREGQRLRAAGYTLIAAASEVGIGAVTLWKYEKRLREQGEEGLIPKISRGRPPAIDSRIYSDELVLAVQRLACIYGSAKAGALAFARSNECPPALADYIAKRQAIPVELRRRVGFKRRPLPCRTAGNFVRVEGIPSQIAA